MQGNIYSIIVNLLWNSIDLIKCEILCFFTNYVTKIFIDIKRILLLTYVVIKFKIQKYNHSKNHN